MIGLVKGEENLFSFSLGRKKRASSAVFERRVVRHRFVVGGRSIENQVTLVTRCSSKPIDDDCSRSGGVV